ncbi:MAG: hypothetical protein DRH08_04315 [Deltaproteobacteria bacterium]|nr:MAG: hypothetical protein DRH08_04315 [Deltaproteobacteria bacterium]
MAEAGVLDDATYVQVIQTQDVAETAVIVSSATPGVPGVDVRDDAVIVSNIDNLLTARYTVRDSAVVQGYATTSAALDVRDSFVGDVTTTIRTIGRVDVTDTAVITGTPQFAASASRAVDVLESAVIVGYTSNRLAARLVAHEEAFLSDNIVGTGGVLGDSGYLVGTVWTASIHSWGMSRHSGDGITQRGTRFAVSPAGLFEIGVSYSDALLDTGHLDLKTKALKHVPTVYLQGSHDGDMIVTVSADRNGARAVHSYTPVARPHGSSRSIRVDIGRGFRSTYYKLQIATTGRTELFGGGVLVARTERRI